MSFLEDVIQSTEKVPSVDFKPNNKAISSNNKNNNKEFVPDNIKIMQGETTLNMENFFPYLISTEGLFLQNNFLNKKEFKKEQKRLLEKNKGKNLKLHNGIVYIKAKKAINVIPKDVLVNINLNLFEGINLSDPQLLKKDDTYFLGTTNLTSSSLKGNISVVGNMDGKTLKNTLGHFFIYNRFYGKLKGYIPVNIKDESSNKISTKYIAFCIPTESKLYRFCFWGTVISLTINEIIHMFS